MSRVGAKKIYFSQVAKLWLEEFQTFETCLIDVRGGGGGRVGTKGWVGCT